MDNKLTQSEFEDLTAWLDGELQSPLADEIARLVDNEPEWAKACTEIRLLNSAMAAWKTPELPANLARRITARAKRPQPSIWTRTARWASTAAAVAAIVVGITLLYRTPTPQANLAQPNIASPNAAAQLAGQAGSSSRLQRHMSPNAMAFHDMSVEDQQELLAKYERNAAASAKWQEQNKWLIAVMASFTPAELQQLGKLTPAQQTRIFLIRRAELIRAGKLPKQ